jgi:hypothetical protein
MISTFFVVFLACSSSSDDTASICNPVIPGDAKIVTSEDELSGDDIAVWVCLGAKATITGDNAEVYVQSGGEAIVEGKKPIVWAENASEVNIRVENAVLYKEPNADVDWIGELKDQLTCNVIDFNDVMLDAGCPQ